MKGDLPGDKANNRSSIQKDFSYQSDTFLVRLQVT
ncbi:hypothetical protein MHOCP_18370 [Moorella humiferrea]